MKMRKLLPVMLIAAALTSCAKEVTYAEFSEKADAVEKDTYVLATAKVKGTKKSDGEETKLDKTITFNKPLGIGWGPTEVKLDGDYAFVTTLLNMHAYDMDEVDGYKYYAGDTFKVTGDSVTYEWDKHGCVTKYTAKSDTNNYTVTVSYTK